MAHRLPPVLAAVALAAVAGIGWTVPVKAGDDCSAKKFEFPAVEKACKDGGRKGAKDLMKAATKKAKAAGKDYKCSHCHKDQKAFGLKDNAVEDLRPFI